MFYSFYGIYTKSFIIFGSVPTFLHNFKFQAFLNKKEKEKPHCAVLGPRARPMRAAQALSPRGRCARSPLLMRPARQTLLPLLSLQDADGETPPVSSFSFTRGGTAAASATASEGLSPSARALPLLPRPRERRAAAMADRGPATRAR